MQISRFRDLLHEHGSDLGHWPEAGAARALLAGSAKAREMLARAERLERALLDTAPSPDAERLQRMRGALLARVARMPLPARPSLLEQVLRPLWPAGAGAAAVLAACGLWVLLASPLDLWPAGGVDPLAATQVLALAEIDP